MIVIFYLIYFLIAAVAFSSTLSGELTRLGLIVGIAGLLFAPFAGLLLDGAVQRKNVPISAAESPWRTGALLSMCFLVPWVYVMLRVYEVRFPACITPYRIRRISYCYLVFGPILMLLIAGIMGLLALGSEPLGFLAVIFIMLFFISAISTCIDMRAEKDGNRQETALSMLFPKKDLAPLARALAWTVIARIALHGIDWVWADSDLAGWFSVGLIREYLSR